MLLQPAIYLVESITTLLASSLLSLSGTQHAILWAAEPIIRVAGVDAVIGRLCAGDLEMALIAAIVMASSDRAIRQRLWGAFFGILTVFAINALRIAIVLWAGINLGWNAADFTHDVLFRMTLVVVILGYYAVWYLRYDDAGKRLNNLFSFIHA